MKSLSSYLINENNQIDFSSIKPGNKASDVSKYFFDTLCKAIEIEIRHWFDIKTKFDYNIEGEKKQGKKTTWKVVYESRPISVKDEVIGTILKKYYLEAHVEFWYDEGKSLMPDSIDFTIDVIFDDKNIGKLFYGKKITLNLKTSELSIE